MAQQAEYLLKCLRKPGLASRGRVRELANSAYLYYFEYIYQMGFILEGIGELVQTHSSGPVVHEVDTWEGLKQRSGCKWNGAHAKWC